MKREFLGLIGAAALMTAGAVSADITIDLGGGWQATIFDEANVDIEVDFVGEDFIVIQKLARFERLDKHTGMPMPQSIAFNQIAPDDETVPTIIITEEFIFNDTPFDWVGFRMSLLGNKAFWDDSSADISSDPFTDITFADDMTEIFFSGGVIASGGSWNPGADKGALTINVNLENDDPVKFVLKEFPLIPAPGAFALLLGAGLFGRSRKRR